MHISIGPGQLHLRLVASGYLLPSISYCTVASRKDKYYTHTYSAHLDMQICLHYGTCLSELMFLPMTDGILIIYMPPDHLHARKQYTFVMCCLFWAIVTLIFAIYLLGHSFDRGYILAPSANNILAYLSLCFLVSVVDSVFGHHVLCIHSIQHVWVSCSSILCFTDHLHLALFPFSYASLYLIYLLVLVALYGSAQRSLDENKCIRTMSGLYHS